MRTSATTYSNGTASSATEFSVQTLLHAGLDENVSVPLQLAFILAVTLFVLGFQFILESVEAVIERHPTYWTLLNKMYREVLMGGLTEFVSRRIDQWDVLSQYSQAKLNLSDSMVLYFSLSIAIQSALMFMMLRRRNRKVDALSVLGARDLLEYMNADPVRAASRLSQSAIKTKILQHFFLTTFGLPDLFSFPKYLRSIQDTEIFSLFDIEIIEWLLLVAVYTFFFWMADFFEVTRFIPETATDVTIEAGVGLANAERIQASRVVILLFFVLVLSLSLLSLYYFIRHRVHQIVVHAGGHRESYVEALTEIAAIEDIRLATPISNNQAIAMMATLAESLSDVEDHSSIWDLIMSGLRYVAGRSHQAKANALPSRDLHLRFFSRKAIHVFAKILLSFNAMYFALIWATFNASIGPVISSGYAVWYPPALVGIMAVLVFNMMFFAPRLVRQLALVNATVRINPNELKAVIEHYSDVLEMQGKMAEAIAAFCDANLKDMSDFEADVMALDADQTQVVEVEALRSLIKRYGFRFSKNKFQTFVRLQFHTRGTKVPYVEFTTLLASLLRQIQRDDVERGSSDDDDVMHPDLHHSNQLHDEAVDNAAIAATASLHEAIGLSTKKRDMPLRQASSGSFRRPTPLLLHTLSAYQRVNAEDDATEEAAAYASIHTPGRAAPTAAPTSSNGPSSTPPH
ncbi:hypothetical protein H310_05254 [Aphanomyces invadans]|uniref:EF-hand domain-containing protein n=1 Tax=Aphanomyces invadans TaxID=157072 RepID=A0A024U950_9STRA|nr:hypothetical protein H310_05254 [Aphanomyces invadans]ETW02755.1 hypothetical protein H310_05254 [Aphanomyces invadans]RHY32787.1 hypothetical protein DYB32_002245 [Aphanomyces invadans]|eukprot:XP_008868139.1 hypothetical protein H310_05254 [Aphanomyces invadans]